MYNMTQLKGVVNFYDMIVYANDAADGLLTGLFVVALFIIMLMSLKKNGLEEALLTSGFLCFVLSILLRYANLINFMYVIAFLAITVLSGLYAFIVKRE